MIKYYAGIVFVFVFLTITSFIIEGGVGVASTKTTVTLSSSATTMTVDSTSGFLDQDILYVDDEQIFYDTKTATQFQNLVRGYGNTGPDSHVSGSRVFTEASNVLNNAVGFNVAAVSSVSGDFSATLQVVGALLTSLPEMVLWDYSFFYGNLNLIKVIVFYPISAGLVIGFVITFAQIAQGILRR